MLFLYAIKATRSLVQFRIIATQKRFKIDINEKRGMPQVFNHPPIESEDPMELVRQKITGIYEEDGNVLKKPGCQLCWQGLDEFTYRDVLLISQFISPIGRIYDRHETGICKKMQAKLRVEVKKARGIGLIPKAMTPQQVQLLKQKSDEEGDAL